MIKINLLNSWRHVLSRNHNIPSDCDNFYVIRLDPASCEPTKQEIELLLSYRKFIFGLMGYSTRYLDTFGAAVEGHNTVVFIKNSILWIPSLKGWAYKRISWRSGYPFVPHGYSEPLAPWTLMQVLDFINSYCLVKWNAWKFIF